MASDGTAALATHGTETAPPTATALPAPPAHPIPAHPIPVVPLWHAAPARPTRDAGHPLDPA
ncbi:hypothetical protein ACIRBX_11195 [Kitasatospora sp. NPDC096147]|uniref:hypothetical protein n=1 Tax=Kitasatospora sp. NPDC096147 TaxID=3364093 RepID=UPI003806B9D6